MILTGGEIHRETKNGRIVIDPFDERCLEPNSYGFHLGDEVLVYQFEELDAAATAETERITLPASGYCLEPGRVRLASTLETLGSDHYAATLYGRLSVASMGIWIQVSAPLGHTGAIIPWTLEINSVIPVLIYPRMRIGKIAFWQTGGNPTNYIGKYSGSSGPVASRLAAENVRGEAI